MVGLCQILVKMQTKFIFLYTSEDEDLDGDGVRNEKDDDLDGDGTNNSRGFMLLNF